MTGLPIIPCPACNTQIPMEVWIAHQGARQALVALADLHGSQRLASMAIRYLALFAPEKRTLTMDRVATLLIELGDLVRPARVEWEGRTHAAPLDSWVAGMELMLADTKIRRPLKNHNYLRAVVAGMADHQEAKQETKTEQRRQGHAGQGGAAARSAKSGMPADIRETLAKFKTEKGASNG